MKIQIVETPASYGMLDISDRKYNKDIWSVEESMYAERDGGIKRWFEYLKTLEAKGFDTVYLYDIRALNQQIVNGGEPEIIYYVRADYKILNY